MAALTLDQLKFINDDLSVCICSMCAASGRATFRIEQAEQEWLYRYVCKNCGYPQIADLMANCPDCRDEYVSHGPDGCERCHDTHVVTYYSLLRWQAKAKYHAEATRRIAAFSRLQYEAAEREWERDWPV